MVAGALTCQPMGTADADASDDLALFARLRDGDEAAFEALVRRHNSMLVRLARARGLDATAEEAAQDAWIEVLRCVDRFEGRSAVRTWLCGILVNVARAGARKEARSVPFSSLGADDSDANGASDTHEPAVDSSRFDLQDGPWTGHWAKPVPDWPTPESAALTTEMTVVVQRAIASLPSPQREVIVLRDVEDLSAEDVCGVLELSDGNQRVLLHRARSKVRAAVEHHFSDAISNAGKRSS